MQPDSWVINEVWQPKQITAWASQMSCKGRKKSAEVEIYCRELRWIALKCEIVLLLLFRFSPPPCSDECFSRQAARNNIRNGENSPAEFFRVPSTFQPRVFLFCLCFLYFHYIFLYLSVMCLSGPNSNANCNANCIPTRTNIKRSIQLVPHLKCNCCSSAPPCVHMVHTVFRARCSVSVDLLSGGSASCDSLIVIKNISPLLETLSHWFINSC